MRRTELLQEIWKMGFREAYEGWNQRGMCERSFRCQLVRFEAEWQEGLGDRRLERASNRAAPIDEVVAVAGVIPSVARGLERPALS